ncbi:Uncharacterized protein PBTT_06565 [Plasmodiophora brassicae]
MVFVGVGSAVLLQRFADLLLYAGAKVDSDTSMDVILGVFLCVVGSVLFTVAAVSTMMICFAGPVTATSTVAYVALRLLWSQRSPTPRGMTVKNVLRILVNVVLLIGTFLLSWACARVGIQLDITGTTSSTTAVNMRLCLLLLGMFLCSGIASVSFVLQLFAMVAITIQAIAYRCITPGTIHVQLETIATRKA